MKTLLVLILLTILLAPNLASATDLNEADAYKVATNLGVYDPINGDSRWVYTDSCDGQALVVSYRVQTGDKATTMVRQNGVVIGRWERVLSTNILSELVMLPGCWDYLHTLGA